MYYILYRTGVHIFRFVYEYRKTGRDGNPQFSANTETAHQFQEYTYKKITPCDFCSQVLRGKFVDRFYRIALFYASSSLVGVRYKHSRLRVLLRFRVFDARHRYSNSLPINNFYIFILQTKYVQQ